MAVRFDAAADRLLRTANMPSTGGPWTVSFWFRITTDTDTYAALCFLGDNNYGAAYHYVGLNSDGTTVLVDITGGTGTGTNLSTGTWYHMAIVRGAAANRTDVYLNGTLDVQVTQALTSNTRFEFGAVGTSNLDPFNGRMHGIKWWSSALDAAAIAQERELTRPNTFAALEGWYPLIQGAAADLLEDWSGNGRAFTAGGTLTIEDGPPVSFGAHTSRLISALAAAGTTYPSTVAGTLTTAGALVNQAGKITAGTVTTAGVLVRSTQKGLAGTITTAGALVKLTAQAATGTLTTAGALVSVRTVLASVAGTLTTVGTLVQQVGKLATGAVTTAGALVRLTDRALTGTVTTAGALSGVRTVLQALTGALTTAGALVMLVGKGLSGAVTTAGTLNALITKAFTGVLTFAGGLTGVPSGGPGGYWTAIVDINTRWRAYLEQLYSYALDGRRDVTSLVRRWLAANPTTGTDENTRLKRMDDDSLT